MADSDDDVPPPLESLSGQLEALQLRAGGSAPSSSTAAGELPVAATTIVNSAAAPAKPAAPQIKKGFFDAKPSKPKPKPAAAPPKPKADEEEIIEIKARKDTFGSGPRIPDFMKIEPSEQEKAYAAYRNQLQDALKPTPDMVSKVAADPMLAAGFDDPEVMAAVADVAKNPANMAKYQNKPKVMAFYKAMASMMGDKLAGMGAAAPQPPGQPPQPGPWPQR